mmetsp:Transcript_64572/g.178491  ORF Transcript_64572/g.178491 Transcript_64572/m.178491 type:complete len:168 (-) Transcript_64572:225-728(-)
MPMDTELHKAAYKGDLASVMEELERGVAVDEPGAQERTALQRACGADQLSVVKHLLKVGASASVGDKSNRISLHWAACAGSVQCLQAIMDSGQTVDVNATTRSGNTALHMAADAGRLDACRFLLGVGANADIKTPEDKLAVDLAKDGGHKDVYALLGGRAGGGCTIL